MAARAENLADAFREQVLAAKRGELKGPPPYIERATVDRTFDTAATFFNTLKASQLHKMKCVRDLAATSSAGGAFQKVKQLLNRLIGKGRAQKWGVALDECWNKVHEWMRPLLKHPISTVLVAVVAAVLFVVAAKQLSKCDIDWAELVPVFSLTAGLSAVDYALTSVLKKVFAMFGKTAGFWGAVSAIGSAGIITFVIDLFQHCTFLKRRGQFSWWRLLEYGITCAFPKAIATAALATAMATFLPLWVAVITFLASPTPSTSSPPTWRRVPRTKGPGGALSSAARCMRPLWPNQTYPCNDAITKS